MSINQAQRKTKYQINQYEEEKNNLNFKLSQNHNIKIKNRMQILKFLMKKPFFSKLSSKLVE